MQTSIYDDIQEMVPKEDPFWTRYRFSVVDALTSIAHALERSGTTDEQGPLKDLLHDINRICELSQPKRKVPRSVIVLAIHNIRLEFDHIVDLESKLYAPLNHILDDLDGSHDMTDIQFFCDLRTTFQRKINAERAVKDLGQVREGIAAGMVLGRCGP